MRHDHAASGAPGLNAAALPDTFAEALAAAKAEPPPPEAQRAFLDRIIADYRPDELPGVDAADLGAALAAFWIWAAAAPPSPPSARLIRCRGADGRDLGLDLLEIVQADAPFLVDSVMGAVTDWGCEVQAMFHPLLALDGQWRSLIQIWLAPVAEERRDGLVAQVLGALDDVHAAVADWPAMLALLARSIDELDRVARLANRPEGAQFADGLGGAFDLDEQIAFLRWMEAGHFVLLGARIYGYPRTADGGYAAEEPLDRPGDSLGVLADPARAVLRRNDEPAVLSAVLRRRLDVPAPVVVAKANLFSRVHRRVFMDYVGVRRYGPDGKPSGETRFVGLFTAPAYSAAACDTPLLRRKVEAVMAAAGFPAESHNATRLANILETWPRDELFQITPEALLPMALGVLHLSDRPRFKLFVRRDAFERFASVLLFAPRDRYDERLRLRAGEILAKAYGGRITAAQATFSDAPLARVHYIVELSPEATAKDRRDPDLAAAEAAIARAARTWSDDLEAVLRSALPEPGRAAQALAAYADAFPAGYREHNDADEALADIQVIEALDKGESVHVRAFRHAADSPRRFRFKLYHSSAAPASLARMLSVLENMGLDVVAEEGFETAPRRPGARGEARDRTVWIHAFLVEDDRGEALSFSQAKGPFERTFMAVWRGSAENDRFNRLVLELGADWRDAALLRALARFRGQTGLDPSQAVQEAALAGHPKVAGLILRLFAARLDPAAGVSSAREAAAADLSQEIDEALMAVNSLDDDRVLRRMAALVMAITRTNYYQRQADGCPKAYISFKIASRELADLPTPKPFREIFVASPVVEGVHLRFGPVARGGLRWSDRRDDFRTEVLGLVKAQQVKNAVIVPVGSKGGFYPKQLPRAGSATEIREAAIVAYQTFLRGLLDITDTLGPDGAVIHPSDVVVHDGDDPYLVVAADKGTATFSDIANAEAAAYGFWLGDAFASGGSAGYDHKAMGITARGAWESVKRHFRELGKDIQTEPFTVIGVGDMSGDVFGNGMLLSSMIRLRAAFDHRHVFIDPYPDTAVSFAERRRLFDLPASSWDDYDRTLISPGGGVWPRSLKSIPVSAEMATLLDISAAEVSPAELISAILKGRAELLYFGGIGTYVKAARETQLDVGDKANDAVRVNAGELRCRVVAEGANLGVTQAGRVEYALAGGRINTDAIDNSAGVDTSDHEVNIKILTGLAERAGLLDPADRDALLASMTGDIASHVLAHNYDQTLQLSLQEAEGPALRAADLDAMDRFMIDLEGRGRLDRALEGLPSSAMLAERLKDGKGLARPERAVLLAYGKLELCADIIASDAPDDPYFEATLRGYFPAALSAFSEPMSRHPLRREIIATVIGNDIVNLCGPTFAPRMRDGAGCDTNGLVVAFEAARQTLRFADDWARVSALDGQIPAVAQAALYAELVRVLRGQAYWIARLVARGGLDTQGLIDRYRPAVDTLRGLIPAALSAFERKAAVRRSGAWTRLGAPKTLAHSISLMRPLTFTTDLADIALRTGWPLANVAYAYHRAGGQFGFDRLREAAASRSTGDHYERLAVRRLIEDILAEQAVLTGAIIRHAGDPASLEDPARDVGAVTAWAAAHGRVVKSAKAALAEIEASPGGWTFAKLTIANAGLRDLAAAQDSSALSGGNPERR